MVSVYLGLAQKLEPEKKEETGKLIPADSAIVWSLWSIGRSSGKFQLVQLGSRKRFCASSKALLD